MIEVAHAILEQNGKELTFAEILNAVQDYLKKSDDEIKSSIARFYAEMNIDGSFIPLGNNVWALRSWYAIDEIDEEVIALDELDDEDEKPIKKNGVKLMLSESKMKSILKMKQQMQILQMKSYMTMKILTTKKMKLKHTMLNLKKSNWIMLMMMSKLKSKMTTKTMMK